MKILESGVRGAALRDLCSPDIDFFRIFLVNDELGTLTWGKEINVAPELLYAEATGSGLPAWAEEPADEDSTNNNA